jgi:hypothetical protein
MSAVHKYFTQQQLFVALDARNTCFSIRPPKQQLFFIEDDPSNCRPKPFTIVYDAIEPERHCLYPENGAASRPRLVISTPPRMLVNPVNVTHSHPVEFKPMALEQSEFAAPRAFVHAEACRTGTAIQIDFCVTERERAARRF